MKKIICLLFMLALISQSNAQLRFDSSKGTLGSLEMPNGEKVSFTAYEKLYYVTNVEDSTYQYLNVYIPQGATQQLEDICLPLRHLREQVMLQDVR